MTIALEAELRAALEGEVRFDKMARALYAADASNYRIAPTAVVYPASADDIVATVDLCRRYDVPIVARGGGTSTAGQAIGAGIVLDCSRHLNRVLSLDPERRLAVVEPGVVLDDLQRAAAPHGLRFGPDPSTHDRCTIGGMIGNNACGSHSIRFGKTDDNVESLDLVGADGSRLLLSTLGATTGEGAVATRRAAALDADLSALVDDYAEAIRLANATPLPRRVSGYGLHHLLPERGARLASAVVGSEGTLGIIAAATLRLVEAPTGRALLVLGFTDRYAAADFVPALLPASPLTLEGIDSGLLELARRGRSAAPIVLPEGAAFLLAEIGGADDDAAAEAAREIAAALGHGGASPSSLVVVPRAAQAAIWRVREDGAGLATRLPDGGEAWPGWEDAAVPPERLGEYLRSFDALLARHGRRGLHYGHYGEGCVHVRVDFDFSSTAGVTGFRRFIEDAADLVVSFGGSLSGEHGDGQARGELLGKMFSPPMLDAFSAFKAAFDGEDAMNPGRGAHGRALDADLRVRPDVPSARARMPLTLVASHEDLGAATRRCVGVGKCRRLDGGAMCPSFKATHAEEHSPRGRARLLGELVSGDLLDDGWRSTEVLEALDLCLGCKACKVECPVGVDIAAYRVDFLARHFRHRLRPRSHYSFGFLPLVLRAGSLAPRLANALVRGRSTSLLLRRAGGISPSRALPSLAPRPRRSSRRRPRRTAAASGAGVTLFSDCFTTYLEADVAAAATEVLTVAGRPPTPSPTSLCCGLTWHSTGQLGIARAVLRRTVRWLAAHGDGPIVVLEPSCAAMLRDEAPVLLGEEATGVAGRIVGLADVLDLDRYRGLRLPGPLVTQVHCHEFAGTGGEAARALASELAGAAHEVVTSCCGLAGNFGLEAGHEEVSRTIAEAGVLRALDAAGPDAVLLADGFSCRTQVRELAGRPALHLAQLLREALRTRADDGAREVTATPGE
jgi:FAD/FMN-containing dehydrogenase/Fe-S oxidoreductase